MRMRISEYARRGAAAALLLTTTVLAACGDDPVASDPAQPVGIYAMRAVAGAPVPATAIDMLVPDESGAFHLKVEVSEGTVTLYEDGSYLQKVKRKIWYNGQLSTQGIYSDHGTWDLSGPTIILESDLYENHSLSGSWVHGELTLHQDLSGEDGGVPNVPFTYRK